jgi:hypothetical protein
LNFYFILFFYSLLYFTDSDKLLDWVHSTSHVSELLSPLFLPQLRSLCSTIYTTSYTTLSSELLWLLSLYKLRKFLQNIEKEQRGGGKEGETSRSKLFPIFMNYTYGDDADSYDKLLQKLSNWFSLAEELDNDKEKRKIKKKEENTIIINIDTNQVSFDYGVKFLLDMLIPPPSSIFPVDSNLIMGIEGNKEENMIESYSHTYTPSHPPPLSRSYRHVSRRTFEVLSPRLSDIRNMCIEKKIDLSIQLRKYIHIGKTKEMMKNVKIDLHGNNSEEVDIDTYLLHSVVVTPVVTSPRRSKRIKFDSSSPLQTEVTASSTDEPSSISEVNDQESLDSSFTPSLSLLSTVTINRALSDSTSRPDSSHTHINSSSTSHKRRHTSPTINSITNHRIKQVSL